MYSVRGSLAAKALDFAAAVGAYQKSIDFWILARGPKCHCRAALNSRTKFLLKFVRDIRVLPHFRCRQKQKSAAINNLQDLSNQPFGFS
jgi:hypothetical protein